MNEILDRIEKLEGGQKLGLAIVIVALIVLFPPIVVMGIVLVFLLIVSKISIPLINECEKSAPRREPIPEKVKIYVWRRDGGRCVYCKRNEKLEYDHIIPVSKGGSNTSRNIQLLCEHCNRSKSTKIGLEEYF